MAALVSPALYVAAVLCVCGVAYLVGRSDGHHAACVQWRRATDRCWRDAARSRVLSDQLRAAYDEIARLRRPDPYRQKGDAVTRALPPPP